MIPNKEKPPYYLIGTIYDKSRFDKKINKIFSLLTVGLIFLSVIFFSSWLICIQYESSIVLNGNWLSKFFYFLNWNLWDKFIFSFNYGSRLNNAIINESIIFLIFFYFSTYSFVVGYACAISLLYLSVKYKKNDLRIMSICYFFPIINIFLYLLFASHKFICYLSKKIPSWFQQKGQSEWLIKLDFLVNLYLSNFYHHQSKFLKKDKFMVLSIEKNQKEDKVQRIKNWQRSVKEKLLN